MQPAEVNIESCMIQNTDIYICWNTWNICIKSNYPEYTKGFGKELTLAVQHFGDL